MASDIWQVIRAEREALADDLATMPDERWDTPSLCAGWTVRDVLAHMTATAKISPLAFFPKLAGAGFNLAKMQAGDIARERGTSPEDTLGHFRSIVASTKHPPGPGDTWLGEVLVHSQDIRRPLGIAHEYPIDSLVRVADFYKRSNLVIGTKKRVAGLRLEATDASWNHGDGPVVRGPIASLVMAMTGRQPATSDLSGDGVATLANRG